VRVNFAETFYATRKKDPRLCPVVADISPAGAIDKFRNNFPDRFVNMGVAEQIVTVLRPIEVSMTQGDATPMACRDAGIYRWRNKYGGLSCDPSATEHARD
jgi:transketolase C-terminal domain/subunit